MLWLFVIMGLVFIAWQDFRHRAVYTLAFPVLLLLIIAHTIRLGTFSLSVVLVNLGVVLVQLALLNVVVFWYRRKWLMQGEQWLGWGDVVFFFLLSFCFSTINFLLFHVMSMVVILFSALIAMAAGRAVKYIPLAGGQAALLACLVIADHANQGAGLHNDTWVLDLLG